MSANVLQANEFNNTVAASSFTFTPITAPSPGSGLIVLYSFVTKTRTPGTLSDNGANAGWTNITGGGGSTSGSCFISWLPVVVNALTQITIPIAGGLTSKTQVGFMEVTGLSGLDTGATGGGGTFTNNTVASNTPSQAITTSNPDDFIVAGIGSTALSNIASGPFTFVMDGGGAGLHNGVAIVEELSAGTYSANWTLGSSVVSTTAIAAFTVAPSSMQVQADLATVASAGQSAAERERFSLSLATVASSAFTPTGRLRSQGGLATVSAAGLPATIPGTLAENFRNRIWKPVIDLAASKWNGFGRNPS